MRRTRPKLSFLGNLARDPLPQKTRRLAIEQLEDREVPSVSVLSYHNDTGSTGQNLSETILTPANVNPSTFGKLFSVPIDDQAYAQPLIMAGVNITIGPSPGLHNVAYVATEHDSLCHRRE